MDYNSQLETSKKELEAIRIKKASLLERVRTLCSELNIDPDGDIAEQVTKLKGDLEMQKSTAEEQLKSLNKELEELESAYED